MSAPEAGAIEYDGTNLYYTDASNARQTLAVGGSLSNYLPLTGGALSGILNMGSNKITSVTDPTTAQDAATKNYVDTQSTNTNYVKANGSIPLSSDWDVGSKKLTNLTDPSSNQDAATKNYVTTVTGQYLPLTGGTMTGSITGRASTTAPGTAPIKLQTGVLMTAPESGGLEYDGTNLYYTDGLNSRERLTSKSYVDTKLATRNLSTSLPSDGQVMMEAAV
jgi:hypothetical protein